jgi:hypothetical protein
MSAGTRNQAATDELLDTITQEQNHAGNHDQRRYANLLQGLG